MKAPKGFTLLLAILIVSIIALVGIGIATIAEKELNISYLSLQSEHALTAADRITECAAYWDTRYASGTPALAWSPFPTSTVGVKWNYPDNWGDVECAGQKLSASNWTVIYEATDGADTQFTLHFDQPGDTGTCATITVSKRKNAAGDVDTSIQSGGFSSCDPSQNRRASRQSEVTFSKKCLPYSEQSDMVLVLDRSGSMNDGSPPKITLAKDAIKSFANVANIPPDQIGLVTFSDTHTLNQQLTQSKPLFVSRVTPITASGYTEIQLGVWQARAELFSARAKAGHKKIMVVLTDGTPNPSVTKNSLIQEANAAKAMGIDIYTIGLGVAGVDLDEALLKSVASDPSQYYHAQTGSDLDAVYQAILAAINCV